MKRYFIIFFSMLISVCAFGQTGLNISANQPNTYIPLRKYKGDTLGYVQHNFIENKQKYIGKDLNFLLKDLEIPIKQYSGSLSLSMTDVSIGGNGKWDSKNEKSLLKDF